MHTTPDIVTFNADGALYGVPVNRVQEILDLCRIAPMPQAPAHLLGIIDLRGANIPVVDLRHLLGLPCAEDTPQSRILVVSVHHAGRSLTIGVKTDRVIEVTQLDDATLKPMEETDLLRWHANPVAGIGRRKGAVVSVLDLDRLFVRIDLLADDQAA